MVRSANIKTDRTARAAKPLVPYYRVSTGQQERSGLGLDAQRDTFAHYCAATARSGSVVEWVEREEQRGSASGTSSTRPTLLLALDHCRTHGATLFVAKLDRLTRSVPFLRSIVDTDVDVVFGDLPEIPEGAMGRFLLTLMAAVAELEAGLVSERTRAALAQYKEGGKVSRRLRERYPEGVPEDVLAERAGKLGAQLPECRGRMTGEARVRGNLETRAAAARHWGMLPQRVADWRRVEGLTLRACADRLEGEGIKTRRGGSDWTETAVKRLIERANGNASAADRMA